MKPGKSITAFFCVSSLSAILLFFVLSCDVGERTAVRKNSLVTEGLRGRVKSMAESSYMIMNSPGESEKGELVSEIHRLYDPEGNIMEERSFNSDRSIGSLSEYKYDEKGKLLERIETDSEGEIIRKLVYENDEENNITVETTYNNLGELEYRVTFRYDERGNLIDRDGFRPARPQYNVYLSYGNGTTGRTPSGGIVSSWESRILYWYDDKGNMTEERHCKPDGSPETRYISRYDNDGKLAEKTVFNTAGDLVYRVVFRYSNSGEITGEYHGLTDDDLELFRSFRYDQDGLLAEENIMSGMGITNTTVKYEEYDKSGNWHKRSTITTSARTGKIYSEAVTARTIVYY